MGFGRRGEIFFQDIKHFETFPIELVITKEELGKGLTFDDGDEGIGDGHGCLDIVVLAKSLNMFKLSDLASRVLFLLR